MSVAVLVQKDLVHSVSISWRFAVQYSHHGFMSLRMLVPDISSLPNLKPKIILYYMFKVYKYNGMNAQ